MTHLPGSPLWIAGLFFVCYYDICHREDHIMTSRTISIVVTENEGAQLLQIVAQAPLPYNVSHPLISKLSRSLQPITREALDSAGGEGTDQSATSDEQQLDTVNERGVPETFMNSSEREAKYREHTNT